MVLLCFSLPVTRLSCRAPFRSHAVGEVPQALGVARRVEDRHSFRVPRVEEGPLQRALGALPTVPQHQVVDQAQAQQAARPASMRPCY